MKIRLGTLRRLIRESLEAGNVPGAPSDDVVPEPGPGGYEPPKGFYDYDIERGTDIHSFWYRSPGREPGSEGDPGRPTDAFEYLGFRRPKDDAAAGDDSEAGAEGSSEPGGEDAAEDGSDEPTTGQPTKGQSKPTK